MVQDLRCYKMLIVQGLGFGVQGFSLGFRVYNALVNSFNKQLNKSYKTPFRML